MAAKKAAIAETSDDSSIFVSWSGERSQSVAEALVGWLPNVIQSAKPWMSKQIDKGSRWSEEVSSRLSNSWFGIVVLTPENLREPWILFEAGAISKTVQSARLWTYLCGGLSSTQLEYPLAQFQATIADRAETLKLVRSINGAVSGGVDEERLSQAFGKWWGDLEPKLKLKALSGEKPSPARPQEELLDEIVQGVRELLRRQSHPTVSGLASGSIYGSPSSVYGSAGPVRVMGVGGTPVDFITGSGPVEFKASDYLRSYLEEAAARTKAPESEESKAARESPEGSKKRKK